MVEEVHRPTDLDLHETERLETSGYQTEEILIGEMILIPMFLPRAGEPSGLEVVLPVLTAGGRAVQPAEAETILIPPGHDLLFDDPPPGEMSVQDPALGGGLGLPMAADHLVPQSNELVTLLHPTHGVHHLQPSESDYLPLIEGVLIGLALLLEDLTRRGGRVIRDPEGIGKGLKPLQNARSEGARSPMTTGDGGRRHRE